ncbi:MAG: transporter [Planctomycetota bacterium]
MGGARRARAALTPSVALLLTASIGAGQDEDPAGFTSDGAAAPIASTVPARVAIAGSEGFGSYDLARPDRVAPYGVLQDRVLRRGRWAVDYRFLRVHSRGMRAGVERIPDGEVVSPGGFGFATTPTEGIRNEHRIQGLFGWTDRVTLAAIVPIVDLEMDLLTSSGGSFETKNTGVGDIGLAALASLHDSATSRVHVHLGFTAPTGSIDERGGPPTSGGTSDLLPYTMQLGSGTWDLRPGLTATGYGDRWSWGGQVLGTVRLGRNGRGYSLGDRLDATGWAAYRATQRVSLSGRVAIGRVTNVDGADRDLDPISSPQADPTLQAGTRVDGLLGLNALLSRGSRLGLEVGWPIAQRLSGPQLQTNVLWTIGLQLAF